MRLIPLVLTLLFITSSSVLTAQSEITENQKLQSLCKVWGFLKYYHPQVAKGKFNWDEQLLNKIPSVRKAENKEEFSKVLFDWIDGLGKIPKCNFCSKPSDKEYFDKNFDLSWIDDSKVFTKTLSKKLRFIEANRFQGKQHYVGAAHKRVGNIKINNEIEYKDFDWENENLRILTLFRYWNIIEYFFPYKYQTETNWNQILIQMIPRFLHPKTERDFHLAMLELVVSVDDGHAGLVTYMTNRFFGYYWIVAKYKLKDKKAIITGFYNDSLAKQNDFKVGDIITKVDAKKIGTIFKERMKYISGSNTSRKMQNAYYQIFNGSSDSVDIEFIRNEKTYTKTVGRYWFKDFNYEWKEKSKTYKIIDGNIGYVDMGTINIKDVSGMMEELKTTKAIILDLRNYPKGTLYSILNYISSTRNEFYDVIYPDLEYPGKFVLRNGHLCGKNGELKYKGKVVLLVNEKTQSHAEFTAMCLQTGDNVITIGSQTSGADGNVSKFKLANGSKTQISGIGIFYPDGTETQRKGVKIDVEVKPTIQGIIEGRDEVLERAISYIETQN